MNLRLPSGDTTGFVACVQDAHRRPVHMPPPLTAEEQEDANRRAKAMRAAEASRLYRRLIRKGGPK